MNDSSQVSADMLTVTDEYKIWSNLTLSNPRQYFCFVFFGRGGQGIFPPYVHQSSPTDSQLLHYITELGKGLGTL